MNNCAPHSSSIQSTLFLIGMWWRIVYGFARTVLGLALFRSVGLPLQEVGFIQKIMEHELTDAPTDVIVSAFGQAFNHQPVYITYFLAFYFIFWGVVDIVLSVSLLRDRLWSFNVSYLLIGVFVVYEVLRFTRTHSSVLLAVIVIDIVVLWLIRREHIKVLQKRVSSAENSTT